MTESRLLVGVASVLAGTTVLFVVLGFVANPILLLAAVPFAAATYLLWSHATGRLHARMRERMRYREVGRDGAEPHGGARGAARGRQDGSRLDGHERRHRSPGGRNTAGRGATRQPPRTDGTSTLTRSRAASVLEVDPAADDAAVKRAFREKARELHPDAPGGDEAAFKRVRAAYETLRNGR